MTKGITHETIRLSGIEGIARRSGTDQWGNKWLQFDVDWMAEESAGECNICGMMLTRGWLCLDGGEEVCTSHIVTSSH